MITREQLIGAWRSGGSDLLHPDGTVSHVMHPRPGRIMYTACGHMCVVSGFADGVPNQEPAQLTDAQKAAAAEACVAYSGRWELDGEQLLHTIDVAIFPAWIGSTRVRFPSIEGNRMTYRTLPDAAGNTPRIYWLREG